MSLLTDYEELSQVQELGIFKEVLDETLKPILISLEEKFFKMYMDIDNMGAKLNNIKADLYDTLYNKFDEVKMNLETEINEASDQSRTYYHNLLKELSALSSDVESIKLSLKK